LAKCKKCGRSGLFFKVDADGLCADCAKKKSQTAPTMWIDQELKKQDKEFERLTKAETQYEKDNNIEKLISVYEDVFITQKSTLITQSRWFKLVDLYLKAGQNDKAWAWLKQLSIQHPDYMNKIEDKRYKILKSEGRLFDAMISLMASIGYSSGNAGPAVYYQEYGKKKFLNDAPPLIKKLKWAESDLNTLEEMLASTIGNTQFDYQTLRKKYKAFLDNKQV
jgi:hypothetical protein